MLSFCLISRIFLCFEFSAVWLLYILGWDFFEFVLLRIHWASFSCFYFHWASWVFRSMSLTKFGEFSVIIFAILSVVVFSISTPILFVWGPGWRPCSCGECQMASQPQGRGRLRTLRLVSPRLAACLHIAAAVKGQRRWVKRARVRKRRERSDSQHVQSCSQLFPEHPGLGKAAASLTSSEGHSWPRLQPW